MLGNNNNNNKKLTSYTSSWDLFKEGRLMKVMGTLKLQNTVTWSQYVPKSGSILTLKLKTKSFLSFFHAVVQGSVEASGKRKKLLDEGKKLV